jgi:hypothetical protein
VAKDIINPNDKRPWPGEQVKTPPPPMPPPVVGVRPPMPKLMTPRPAINREAIAASIRKLTPEDLRRKDKKVEKAPVKEPPPVSLGTVEKGMDLAFNPTRDKLREVTIVDRMQGKYFPLMDMIITGRNHILEIAIYREDPVEYERLFEQKRPVTPDLLDEYLHRTAQWQKSVSGTNLTKITDIALAEVEGRAGEDEGLGKDDPWGKANKE